MKVFPELFVLLAIIVTSMNNAVSSVSKGSSYIVSSSSGSETFYLESNRRGAIDDETQYGEDVVCEAIIKSPFFSIYNHLEILDPVNQKKLLYANIHPKLSRHFLRRPYELVNVSVLKTVAEEKVFSCVAKVEGTLELKLYFVSKVYDFKPVIKKPTPTKFGCTWGRFVFEYSESEKIAYLFAVADEPVWIYDYKPINSTHFEDLKKDLNAISESGEEICRFSKGRKLRICAIGMNSLEFKLNGIRFLPLEGNIEPECAKKNLLFKYKNDKFEFTKWVIGCRAEIIGKPEFTTYFLSLGYEPYQFLIYKPRSEAHLHELVHHFHSHLGTDNSNYTRN